MPNTWTPPPADLWTPPQHLWIPERAGSAGQEAIELGASVGWVADTEQVLMVDAILSERAGRWAAFETAIIEPRQNGKTDAGQVASLYDLFIRKVSRIVWTAHKYKTCADTFAWFAGVCENYDHLRKRVHKVITDMGQQSIQLLPRFTGPQIVFLARTGGGGRGLDGDIVNLDEALYLMALMMGALIPIMSAKPNPQVRYFSSSGLLKSEVLRGLRDRGRAGNDPSLAYAEWNCPPIQCESADCTHLNDSPGCQLDDIDYLRVGNPAAGGRITEEYLAAERRTFGTTKALVTEHLRERTGWWEDPPPAETPDLFPLWANRSEPTTKPTPGARFALGIDTSWDRSTTHIAAASVLADGRARVELVASGPGSNWVPGWLRERYGTGSQLVAWQASGAPVSVLTEELAQIPGLDLKPLTGADMARASGFGFDAVAEGRMVHANQPPMNDAVAGAVAKPLSDSWVIDRKKSTADTSPIVAGFNALWALMGPVEDEKPPPNCW